MASLTLMSDEQAPSVTVHDGLAVTADAVVAAGLDQPFTGFDDGLPIRPSSVPRVMLVEDDFILRANLAELLMLEGYRVTCAADGAEALQRLKTEPTPSVILVDIVMPRLNGIAFRKVQLDEPELRDIPTVALTSLPAGDHGPDLVFPNVIRKPVNLDRLVDLIAKLCPTA